MAEFKLQIDPADKIVFSSKKLGEEATSTTIKITNPLKERISIKVKCTSNEMFRIRPPVAAVNAGESINVNLTFNGGRSVPDNGKHYFVFHYITVKDDKKNPRQLWADHKGEPEGTKKIFIDFKKDGEEEKKGDEKKGDEKKDEEKKDDKKEEKKDEEKKETKKDEKKDEEKKEDKKEEKKDAAKKDEKKEDDKDDEKEEDKKE